MLFLPRTEKKSPTIHADKKFKRSFRIYRALLTEQQLPSFIYDPASLLGFEHGSWATFSTFEVLTENCESIENKRENKKKLGSRFVRNISRIPKFSFFMKWKQLVTYIILIPYGKINYNSCALPFFSNTRVLKAFYTRIKYFFFHHFVLQSVHNQISHIKSEMAGFMHFLLKSLA